MALAYGQPPDFFDAQPHGLVTRELIIWEKIHEAELQPLSYGGMVTLLEAAGLLKRKE